VRLALIPVAVVVFFSAVSVAWALGELSQKQGPAGCISLSGAEGCARATAIDGTIDVVVSPDGRNAYVAGFGSDTVATFDRDPATGALSQKPGTDACIAEVGSRDKCAPAHGLNGAAGLAISPDGRNLYVAALESDAVAVLDRNPATGVLTQDGAPGGCISQAGADGCAPGRALDGPGSVTVSADGRNVYVTSAFANAVAAFRRDAAGDLAQLPGAAGCISEDGTGGACEDGRGLLDPLDLAASPDGANVYVAALGSDSLAVFVRDPATGSLAQASDRAGLNDPNGVTLSPDGGSVYVTTSGALMGVFDRGASGTLTFNSCLTEKGSGGVCVATPGMDGASDVAVSPDGASVYLAGNRSLLSFDRNAVTRALTQKPGCISSDGTGGACQVGRGMTGIESGLTVSPDGRSVYLTAGETDAIAIFNRAMPSPPPPADTLAPTVSGFRVAPKRFRVGSKKRQGSSFRFDLSEPAAVGIEIERARPGRLIGKRCRPTTPKLEAHRPCRIFKRRASLAFAGRSAGANAIRFSGRIGKRALRPGSYRATISPTDAAGNRSAPRRAAFKVRP
jgi:DNA-binding beta-propeller fold protein YncE